MESGEGIESCGVPGNCGWVRRSVESGEGIESQECIFPPAATYTVKWNPVKELKANSLAYYLRPGLKCGIR